MAILHWKQGFLCDKYVSVVSVVGGVCGREVERRSRNVEVPSSIPEGGCHLWDFSIGPQFRREYWCSS